MAKLMFDVNKIIKNIDKGLINGVNKALAFRQPFIKEISPVDTGDYIDHHKIKKAKIDGKFVTGSNFNDSDHAFGVENGFRQSPVNWSKKDGVTIFNGRGAHVFQRVSEDRNITNQVLGIIAKALSGS